MAEHEKIPMLILDQEFLNQYGTETFDYPEISQFAVRVDE